MIRVIPCLDVDRGRVVKGVNFVGLRDAGDPVELAARYDREGADELVFLDITASHEERGTIVELARRTAEEVFIPFTIGGGLRSVEDIRAVLAAGADKVSLNSAAVRDPELIARGLGALRRPVHRGRHRRQAARGRLGWEVFLNGGRRPTGREAVAWAAEAAERGAGELLVTSMDRDGTKDGFDCELLAAVAEPRRSRSSPRAAPGRSTTSPTRSSEGGPTRCWRRRSSTTASTHRPGEGRDGDGGGPGPPVGWGA